MFSEEAVVGTRVRVRGALLKSEGGGGGEEPSPFVLAPHGVPPDRRRSHRSCARSI